MNPTIATYTRQVLKDKLRLCTERERMLFKRMYSHKDLTKDYDNVVNDMPDDKLDWALSQVENTLNKVHNKTK